MARRLTWFAAGVAAGAMASVWGLSAARRASERLQPERVGADVVDSLRDLGTGIRNDFRAAVAEGRAAMHERERELLAEHAEGRDVAAAPRPLR